MDKFVQKVVASLSGYLKGFAAILVGLVKSNKSKLFNDIYVIMLPIVENVSKLDLNDDGVKQHSKEEIIAIIRDTSVWWGNEISEEIIDKLSTSELKRYLVLARTALEVVKNNLSQSNSILNFVLEVIIQKMKDISLAGK